MKKLALITPLFLVSCVSSYDMSGKDAYCRFNQSYSDNITSTMSDYDRGQYHNQRSMSSNYTNANCFPVNIK